MIIQMKQLVKQMMEQMEILVTGKIILLEVLVMKQIAGDGMEQTKQLVKLMKQMGD